MASNKGDIVKLTIDSLRLCKRGDLGEIGFPISDSDSSTDRVIDICNGDVLTGLVTSQGRHGRIDANAIDPSTPNSINKTSIKMKEGESLKKLVPLIS